jgi:hypothetical protein
MAAMKKWKDKYGPYAYGDNESPHDQGDHKQDSLKTIQLPSGSDHDYRLTSQY